MVIIRIISAKRIDYRRHPRHCPLSMKSNEKAPVIIATILCAFWPLAVLSQNGPPLQLDVRLHVKRNHGLGGSFERQLEGGEATVSGRVHNLPGGETALVMLQFDYRTTADIALDELVSQIVISIEEADGSEFSTVTIDPNTIHLNPNRVPLHYFATLYTPNTAHGRNRSGYIVRVQVSGNYE